MPSTKLPRPASPFIGRRRALAELTRLCGSERLVTVTGTSGIGKTRLALHFAAMTGGFVGGVFFVDLAEQVDLEGMVAQVAASLGLQRSVTTAEALIEPLARRGRALVILDNFEQLVKLAGETVGTWLPSCPELHLLVTSRERLRVEGEAVLELSPMELPPADVTAGADDAVGTEALQMWVARRRRAEPGYDLDDRELPMVIEIVRRLDGIPLAIELAAARASVLGPSDLLKRLSQRFEILGRGARGAPARQATMQGAIDWSWELLEPWERSALAQCAVFRGGFVIESAEAVVDLSAFPEAPPVLDVVQTLRDKSLLRPLGAAPGTDAPRMGMFTSIRDYAEHRLRELGMAGEVEARFARHFVDRGMALFEAVDGPDGARALDELAAEQDNLVAVAQRALATPDARGLQGAIGALVAVDVIAWTRGPVGANLELLVRVVDAADAAGVEPAWLSRAFEVRGLTRASIGEIAAGAADLERAVTIAEALGEPVPLARALMGLSWIHLRTRRLDDMEALLDRARTLAVDAGDRHLEAIVIGSLGAVHKERGDFEKAETQYLEALDIHRAIGNRRFVGVAHTRLAILYLEHGKLEALRESAETALEIHREFQSLYIEGLVLTALGAAHHAEGRLDAARQVYGEAIPIHQFMGEKRVHGACLGYLGIAGFEAGDIEVALGHLEEAHQVLSSASEHRHAALFLALHSGIEATLGKLARAEHELGKARRLLGDRTDDKVSTVMALMTAQLGLARARTEQPVERARAAREARTLIDEVTRPDASGASAASRSIDVRIAVRLLERVLDSYDAPADTGNELIVHRLGQWFVPPGGERVDCSRRHPMRRLLVRLAHQRVHRPRVPLSSAALLASGWPDERMTAESAQNRLYVTLNRLRALGLRSILLAVDGGYLLDADTPVRFAADEREPGAEP